MTKPAPDAPWSQPLAVAELPTTRGAEVLLVPDAEQRRAIATAIGAVKISKLRFTGHLKPLGKTDWQLSAQLAATVQQSCVVTLAPVNTRIEETTTRTYLARPPEAEAGSELETPRDDTIEALSEHIDPGAVMVEALALAMPQFPRTPGAELARAQFTEPGKAAMSDADARPFAQLKLLRQGRKSEPK